MATGDKNIIKDDFWLNMGAEIVYNSFQNRKDAVDRLQRTIAWVIGVYGTITLGTLVFPAKADWESGTLLTFGLGFLFLIISYWMASTAIFPDIKEFYGNSSDSIRNAYLITVRRSSHLFGWAVALCSTGVLLYSFAIFYQFGSPAFFKKPTEKPATLQTFSPISVQLRAISKDEFAMQVNSKPASWLHIASLSDTIDQGSTKSSQTPIYVKAEQHQDLWLYTDSTAQLSLSFLIRRLPVRKYFLQISRTDSTEHGTVIHTITKKVNLQ